MNRHMADLPGGGLSVVTSTVGKSLCHREVEVLLDSLRCEDIHVGHSRARSSARSCILADQLTEASVPIGGFNWLNIIHSSWYSGSCS